MNERRISLTPAQLKNIYLETERINGLAIINGEKIFGLKGVYKGTVVTVELHDSLLHPWDRVRVSLHRAHEHTLSYGLSRDGHRFNSAEAA